MKFMNIISDQWANAAEARSRSERYNIFSVYNSNFLVLSLTTSVVTGGDQCAKNKVASESDWRILRFARTSMAFITQAPAAQATQKAALLAIGII